MESIKENNNNKHSYRFIKDPGLPFHKKRLSDINKKLKRKVEYKIFSFFLISIFGSIMFAIFYIIDFSKDNFYFNLKIQNFFFGLSLFLSMLSFGVGIISWSKYIMPNKELVEKRNLVKINKKNKINKSLLNDINVVIQESEIKRSSLLRNTLIGALVFSFIPGIFTLRSLDISKEKHKEKLNKLKHTLWDKNIRIVLEVSEKPIYASDVKIGSIFHAVPENLSKHPQMLREKAKSVILLTRLDLNKYNPSLSREDWHHNGIVAYSKICTHVGCPVALYEQKTNYLLCPCHQSTFDLLNECKPIFGPAKRSLPQLPITIDNDGYLIAKSDFKEPVGPSYWEREK